MTEEQVCRILWRIYLNACVCRLDHGSRCNCDAGDIASAELSDILGEKWHDIMRLRPKTTAEGVRQ